MTCQYLRAIDRCNRLSQRSCSDLARRSTNIVTGRKPRWEQSPLPSSRQSVMRWACQDRRLPRSLDIQPLSTCCSPPRDWWKRSSRHGGEQYLGVDDTASSLEICGGVVEDSSIAQNDSRLPARLPSRARPTSVPCRSHYLPADEGGQASPEALDQRSREKASSRCRTRWRRSESLLRSSAVPIDVSTRKFRHDRSRRFAQWFPRSLLDWANHLIRSAKRNCRTSADCEVRDQKAKNALRGSLTECEESELRILSGLLCFQNCRLCGWLDRPRSRAS